MANRSDPLINSVSGSDPQNSLEYITRQRIYDCRYWKEVCFGLTVSDVLVKSIEQLQCIGSIPYTTFVSLLLKLLQLNAEHDIIYSAFIDQDEFKYTTALGCFYIRLSSRPVEIYNSLEPLYRDYRKLRIYDGGTASGSVTKPFTIWTMDQYIHQLLTSTQIFGITLPRLPSRRTLQEAGYIPPGHIRPTALADILSSIQTTGDSNTTDTDDITKNPLYDSIIERLRYKAVIDKFQPAIIVWEGRQTKKLRTGASANHQNKLGSTTSTETNRLPTTTTTTINDTNGNVNTNTSASTSESMTDSQVDNNNNDNKKTVTDSTNDNNSSTLGKTEVKKKNDDEDDDDNKMKKEKKIKKEKKDKRNYDNLFKKGNKDKKSLSMSTTTTTMSGQKQQQPIDNNNEQNSDEYWNEERMKLGLKPLK